MIISCDHINDHQDQRPKSANWAAPRFSSHWSRYTQCHSFSGIADIDIVGIVIVGIVIVDVVKLDSQVSILRYWEHQHQSEFILIIRTQIENGFDDDYKHGNDKGGRPLDIDIVIDIDIVDIVFIIDDYKHGNDKGGRPLDIRGK